MSHKNQLVKPIMSGNTDSILASLFRTVLLDLNVNGVKFNLLLDKYIINSGLPTNAKESTSIKGNLKKELLKNTMSWKVFMKSMIFLNIRKIEITIRLHHQNDNITEHSKSVVLTSFKD